MVISSKEEHEEMWEESNGQEREGIGYEQVIFIALLPDSPTLCRDPSCEDKKMSNITNREEKNKIERGQPIR